MFSHVRFAGLLAAVLLCGVSVAQEPSAAPPNADAQSTEVFGFSASAQKFNFAKPDADLLKQINAFDKYIEEKGWIFDDPEVSAYVERVGQSVVPQSPIENVKWRFRVIRDPVPNAFALPNGSIYVNSGLLSRLENEAQLAGVLAHESTHVFNRHGYLSYHDMRKRAITLHLLSAAASAAYYAGANALIVNAIGTMIPLILVETMFGYRRELEHESDVYAVGIMGKAGYDPAEMPRALALLRKGPEVDLSQESLFWSDHPKLDDRIRDTTALASSQPQGSRNIEQQAYVTGTRNAVRHDAGLALMLGRPRTALAIARRLISIEPDNPDNYALLGDAYRTLGPRSPEPQDEELTKKGKDTARKLLRKMTIPEYENALLNSPGGRERWDGNCVESEKAYRNALDREPNNASALRGLGFLFESKNRSADAITYLKRYLEVAPEARDARQVRLRLEKLEKATVTPNPA